MTSNWWSWLLGSARRHELADTRDLYERAIEARPDSPFATAEQVEKFALELTCDIFERHDATPTRTLGYAVYRAIIELAETDGLALSFTENADFECLTIEEGVLLRATLARYTRFNADHERLLVIWRDKLLWLFSGILGDFPASAFTDIGEDGLPLDDSVTLPEAPTYELCDKLPKVLERTIITFFDQDVTNAHLFDPIRERVENNALVASGIPLHQKRESKAKILLPTEQRDKSGAHLVEAYLQGTPLLAFFRENLPFAIPFPARFEHTHVVGGTGHGKTQLLQFLINHDLLRSRNDGRSVVIIDSHGDLIETISRLRYFDPDDDTSLADRFVLIDPNDVEHPVGLNMFDFNRNRLSAYSALDQEKILNATVELYEYFFGALLGAELTQRQGLIFRYLARLLIEIPDATIHTLRELMENGEPFRPYMATLTGTARSFFDTRFFDRSFSETKKQILTRLWGVLANNSLERMFCHTRSTVDMFECLNSGKIVLINTAKDLLGQEGSSIFGRFFIALITQAAVQRATVPPHERRASFVYIDEAQDYFDDNISHLLNQARKYRVGLIFAHQNLDQLTPSLRSSVLASTSIKFAGGLSAKDAHALDSDFRCDAEFLLSQKKRAHHTEFACYTRNHTEHAVSVRIPLGHVESLATLDSEQRQKLLGYSRHRYSAPTLQPVSPDPNPPQPDLTPGKSNDSSSPAVELRRQPEAVITTAGSPATVMTPRAQLSSSPRKLPEQPGRGGRQHKYLQHLVKQLAEERGFRASIEESILDGAGRVDVSLVLDDLRIACEISVTTSQDQELGNVEKCIAAGYTEIVVIGHSERHARSLEKFISSTLDETSRPFVKYIVKESLIDYLDSHTPQEKQQMQTVRGYTVRTKATPVDEKEAEVKRKALAEIIARSLNRQRDTSE